MCFFFSYHTLTGSNFSLGIVPAHSARDVQPLGIRTTLSDLHPKNQSSFKDSINPTVAQFRNHESATTYENGTPLSNAFEMSSRAISFFVLNLSLSKICVMSSVRDSSLSFFLLFIEAR